MALGGAWANASFNRKRDDRLRREEQRGVATALRAELAGCRWALLTNAQQLKDPQAGTFLMPEPEMVSQPDAPVPDDVAAALGLPVGSSYP